MVFRRVRVIAVLWIGILAFGGAGLGCDDGGYDGPAVPLMVSAIVSIQPDGSAMVIVSLGDSTSPINMVNDGTVTVNGVPIPKYEEGYLYLGPLPLEPGDDVTIQVRRGLTITATLPFPGRGVVTAPASGDVLDPAVPNLVEWTEPAILPDRYTVWISDDFTESSLGWSEVVQSPATSVEIRMNALLSAMSGITITMQSENETEVFEGDILPYSYFIVSNQSESEAFSTL